MSSHTATSSTPTTGLAAARPAASVTKKLTPGQPGTKRYVDQYGDKLVCVRYRRDPIRRQSYTTVELIIAQRNLPEGYVRPTPVKHTHPNTTVGIQIAYPERDLRALAKDHGATWDSRRKVWLMPYHQARRLGLLDRIAPDDEGPDDQI